jgi:hypothetical protein
MSKKKQYETGPIQLTSDQLDWVSDYIWSLEDYKDYRENNEKIQTRLFYNGDDVDASCWLFRLTPGMVGLLSTIDLLVTTKFDGRVGVVEYEYLIASEMDFVLGVVTDLQQALIFENHADMLVFRLRAQI